MENDCLLQAEKKNINGIQRNLGLDLQRTPQGQSMFGDNTSMRSDASGASFKTPNYCTAGKEMYKGHPMILAEKSTFSFALYQ